MESIDLVVVIFFLHRNEIELREKYQEKLRQLIDEQNEGSTKEITLKIIEKQRVELAEALKKCEDKRVDLLILEQRFVNRMKNDEVAIKQIEEFNYKSRREMMSFDRQSLCVARADIDSLEKYFKLVDESVDEWKSCLCREERGCHRLRNEIRQLECERYDDTRRREVFEQIRKLDNQKDRFKDSVKNHEAMLEDDVKEQISMNQQLILNYESKFLSKHSD